MKKKPVLKWSKGRGFEEWQCRIEGWGRVNVWADKGDYKASGAGFRWPLGATNGTAALLEAEQCLRTHFASRISEYQILLNLLEGETK